MVRSAEVLGESEREFEIDDHRFHQSKEDEKNWNRKDQDKEVNTETNDLELPLTTQMEMFRRQMNICLKIRTKF